MRTKPPVLVFAFLAACAGRCPGEEAPVRTLEAGDVQVIVGPWGRGMSIRVGGVTVTKNSSLVVTTPPWTPHFYLGPAVSVLSAAVVERIDGGSRLRMHHVGSSDSFVADETITVTQSGRVEQVFEGRFLRSEGQALIQWNMGGLNPAILVGRPFQTHLKSGETLSGVVPVLAESGDSQASRLASDFRAITFDTRIGPIRIEVESPGPLVVTDYRKNVWGDPKNPIFWFGDLGSRFGKDDAIRYRIVYDLPKVKSPPSGSEPLRGEAKVTDRPDAQRDSRDERPAVVPRPKEADYPAGQCDVTGLSDEQGFATVEPPAARDALAEYASFLMRRFPGERRSNRKAPAVEFIQGPIEGTDPAEAYALTIAGDGIRIRAVDARGFLHAVQTMKQLSFALPDGGVGARYAKIRDWPSLTFRGVHLFTGGKGTDVHTMLIRDIIAGLKMNHLVLECEYIRWDSHPEIHHREYGMSKDQVRELLALCRRLRVDVTPLVQSLGHCQWMFENGKNLELCEDPDARWAYCVTDPRTYEFIFQVYQEAIDLFKPAYFHIGHDEFADRGRVPYRESSKKFTVEELLIQDTLKLCGWLRERGVKPMLWGDMFLGPGEGPDACNAKSVESAKELRGKLPKEALVTDWHYAPSKPDAFVSLDRFHEAGLRTVASVWYKPENVVNYARAAYEKKSLGLLQTTWAGYSLDRASFEKEIHQYAVYVLAAEAAWNADRPPDPEGMDFAGHFFELTGMSSLKPANRAGWTADLKEVCNYSRKAADEKGWFGFGPRCDLSCVPDGLVRCKGVAFELTRGERSVVALRGRLSADLGLPSAVRIGLSRRADRLAVLHTVNFACPRGTKVGEYEMEYEDDSRAIVEMIYGRNVFAYGDVGAAAEAPVVWTGANAAGEPVALRTLIWENPHPDRSIRSLTARSADAEGSLVLLGLTGLEGR